MGYIASSTFTIYPSYTVSVVDEDDEAPLDDTEVNLPVARKVPGSITYGNDDKATLRIGHGYHLNTEYKLQDESTGDMYSVISIRRSNLSGGGLVLKLASLPWST